MNLFDLITRKDRRVEIRGAAALSHSKWLGDTWSVIDIGEKRSQLKIKRFDELHPFKTRDRDLGWYASAESGAVVKLSLVSGEKKLHEVSVPLHESPTPLHLHWPRGIGFSDEFDLVLDFSENARLFVHRRLNRSFLYQLAKGRGLEIGPGPRPQIVNSEDTSVLYLEMLTQEEWSSSDSKNKYGADRADWSQYVIGPASSIPVDDASLDFIFSSHVFEHLANPLGHLVHWRSKLKPGGVVLAVVPDMLSCKDYTARASTLGELVGEQKEGMWTPQPHHYRRFSEYRRVRLRTDVSIHVHFYTNSNMPSVLEHATGHLGYRGYDFVHEKNHKDFHFVLYA
ncbi:MAG TPA: methyltransferase domain-containing protein [Bacteroidia bacterium]|nr:methyltransferase domain-containing protein [Bacteroidia bacterium]